MRCCEINEIKKMNYNICIAKPEGYLHSAAFSELAEIIGYGLQDLGHVVAINANRIFDDATNILIGCHLLDPQSINRAPKSSIVLNTEPLYEDQKQWNSRISEWVRRFQTWDYNVAHLDKLRDIGAIKPKLLHLGFHPKLERIAKPALQDIDVLFYGAITERRKAILDALSAAGMHVKAVFGLYGGERDALIARAKVILNMHRTESKIFEIVRVFYLMSNAKAVVSEIDEHTEIDPDYRDGIHGASYANLVESCRQLVKDHKLREALETRSLATIQRLPQKDILLPLLD
jgi:hypothetical protein